jgi:hypothetical protein
MWFIQEERQSIQAKGAFVPWIFIVPIGLTKDSKFSRWIHKHHDEDFEVHEVV